MATAGRHWWVALHLLHSLHLPSSIRTWQFQSPAASERCTLSFRDQYTDTVIIREQDKEATVYVGNLDERVTDEMLWELMLQVGRIVNVHLPKDRVTQTHQSYGFVEFVSEDDADYAARVMNQTRLYGKPIRVNKASADKQKTLEVGAELFVGNLDPMVDEKVLFETFGRFGSLTSAPKASLPLLSLLTSTKS